MITIENLEEIEQDWKGFGIEISRQTMANDGYVVVSKIKLVGCWAHARRYFMDALKAMPKKNDNKSTVTEEGLAYCSKLFEIEKLFSALTTEERYEGRLKIKAQSIKFCLGQSLCLKIVEFPKSNNIALSFFQGGGYLTLTGNMCP